MHCISKDATYYQEQAGRDTFVSKGFSIWKDKKSFHRQVGGVNSAHNQAQKDCETLMNQNQSIHTIFSKHSSHERMITEYA